jgi:hypothetical protein
LTEEILRQKARIKAVLFAGLLALSLCLAALAAKIAVAQ